MTAGDFLLATRAMAWNYFGLFVAGFLIADIKNYLKLLYKYHKEDFPQLYFSDEDFEEEKRRIKVKALVVTLYIFVAYTQGLFPVPGSG